MKNKFNFLIICLLTIIYNYSTAQNNIICGRVEDYSKLETQMPITLSYTPLVGDPEQLTTTPDSIGNFCFRWEADRMQDYVISCAQNGYVLLLSPGDSLYIRFSALAENSKEEEKMLYMGGSTARQNLLLWLYLTESQTKAFPDYDEWEKREQSSDIAAYLTFIDRYEQKIKEHANQFIKKNKVEEPLKTWINMNVRAWKPQNNLVYFYYQNKHISDFDQYLSFMQDLDFPEAALCNSSMVHLAGNYTVWVLLTKFFKKKKETGEADMNQDSFVLHSICQEFSDKPLLKSLMLMSFFDSYIKYQRWEQLEYWALGEFREHINEVRFLGELEKKHEEHKKVLEKK